MKKIFLNFNFKKIKKLIQYKCCMIHCITEVHIDINLLKLKHLTSS